MYLSGVDILDGTPVLDIKPYIPQYDYPDMARISSHCIHQSHSVEQPLIGHAKSVDGDGMKLDDVVPEERQTHLPNPENSTLVEPDDRQGLLPLVDVACSSGNTTMRMYCSQSPCQDQLKSTQMEIDVETHIDSLKEQTNPNNSSSNLANANTDSINQITHNAPRPEGLDRKEVIGITSADWIETPPIHALQVLFTVRAEEQLKNITSEPHASRKIVSRDGTRQAISSILAADPRSTYRRRQCSDRLYYFNVDSLHITCWFDEDIVEVLKIECLPEKPRE